MPVLVTETPVPVMIEEMLRVGRTSVTGVAMPGILMASMSKVLAPEVRMTRPLATSETMKGLFEVAVKGVAPLSVRSELAPTLR